MSDEDDSTPPPPRPKRRLQSQTERDEDGMRARREREAVPGVEVHDDITGKYEGEDLEQARSRRPTRERVGRLEAKHDQLVKAVGDIAVKVGEIHGAMTVIPQLVDVLAKFGHASVTATVDVNKAIALDPIDAKKARRALITQVVAILGGLATAALAVMQARSC